MSNAIGAWLHAACRAAAGGTALSLQLSALARRQGRSGVAAGRAPMRGVAVLLLLSCFCAHEVAEARGRKPKTKGHRSLGGGVAADEVRLSFDGEGKLGIGFLKGMMPLKIRHITEGTWGSQQPELELGMELVGIGATTLIGRSYADAIDLLRAAAGAASSASSMLTLTFQAGEPLPPESERETNDTASNDTASAAGVPRRLAAACKSLRERDLEGADRHLAAFLKAQGHPVPTKGDRPMALFPDEARRTPAPLAAALKQAVALDMKVAAQAASGV